MAKIVEIVDRRGSKILLNLDVVTTITPGEIHKEKVEDTDIGLISCVGDSDGFDPVHFPLALSYDELKEQLRAQSAL